MSRKGQSITLSISERDKAQLEAITQNGYDMGVRAISAGRGDRPSSTTDCPTTIGQKAESKH